MFIKKKSPLNADLIPKRRTKKSKTKANLMLMDPQEPINADKNLPEHIVQASELDRSTEALLKESDNQIKTPKRHRYDTNPLTKNYGLPYQPQSPSVRKILRSLARKQSY